MPYWFRLMLSRSVNHIFLFLLFVLNLCSCQTEPERSGSGLTIGTSLPVLGAIIDELIQEDDKVFVLLSGSGSPHNFQPRPSDILNLEKSNIVILADPDLDGWAVDLESADVHFLSDSLDNQLILFSSGYRNPHFWMDPVLIMNLVHPVAELLCQKRKLACATYRRRARKFAESLVALDNEIATAVSALHNRSVITSHPFFDYFLARYNVRVITTLASIPGHEPSPARIVEILESAKKKNLLGLVAQAGLPDAAVVVIGQETDLPIVYINPVGTVGQTYAEFIRLASQTLLGLGNI